MGTHLLTETTGMTHTLLATALAESLLLAGRIEFFDLRQPNDADTTFVQPLQAAREANDSLLGSAILAHAAFIPGWEKRRDEMAERMRAARTYARRGPASADFLAWLDAVEAECETISERTREALRLIEHGEELLTTGSEHASPDWFTWFSAVRVAAFKGNTQLKAGHLPQARETLTAVLEEVSPSDDKQLTVILGDLAAVEAAQRNPEATCEYAERALETAVPHLVCHRHGPRARRSQESSTLGPTENACSAWTIVSTDGRLPSAPCSIERIDMAR